MLDIFSVIIPVFAIIGLGYLAVRFRLYPAEGTKALVAFVNNFATPCLLCEAMLTSDFSKTFNLAIIVPFYIGALVLLLCGSLIAHYGFGQRPGESVVSGFSATYTNTVLVGIPIIQRAYGAEALPTAFSIIALHAPVLLTIGMVTMELVRRDAVAWHKTVVVIVARVLKNPLLWGVGLGALGNFTHAQVPEVGTAFLTMMSAAVLPASLFGMGGALNEYKLSESWALASIVSFFKLMVHPIIAYVLMIYVLHVPMELARYGIIVAAMPAGINVYIFATYYDRSVNVAANTVLISTVASIATLSFWLLILGH